MLYDQAGNYLYPPGSVKEFQWNVLTDGESIPSWLTQVGTATVAAPVINGVDGDRGFARFAIKAAPAAGNFAGVATAFNIDTADFEEIAFIVYGWASDSNSGTNHNLQIQLSDGSTGCFLQNNQSASPTVGATQLRVYTPTAETLTWELVNGNNGTRRKDVGVVIRPRTREVFICCGDPAEGAGVVWYNVGNWLNVTGQPFQLRVFTQDTNVRYMEFNRLKLRLVGM